MNPAPRSILFVCYGNICRSPTAEALLAKRLGERGLAERYAIRSAGVIARGGDVCPLEAVQVAAEHGVDLRRHLSTPLTAELLRTSDLVVAMDRMIVQYILNLVPDLGARLRLLLDYVPGGGQDGQDVRDPMGQGREVYAQSYRQIEAGVTGLLAALAGDGAEAGDPPAAPEPGR